MSNYIRLGQSMVFDNVFFPPNTDEIAILRFIKPIPNNFSPRATTPVCIPQISKRIDDDSACDLVSKPFHSHQTGYSYVNKNAVVIGFGTSDKKVARTFGQIRENVVQIVNPLQCPINHKQLLATGLMICGVNVGIDNCAVRLYELLNINNCH